MPVAEALLRLDPAVGTIAAQLLRRSIRRAQKPRIRSRVQFALEELILPEGKHRGELLQRSFQPFAIDLLARMDQTRHRRFAVSGCVQSGKTLVTLVVNTLWHLFECGHTVIWGVPEMKLAKKKWLKELLPVIERNPRFRRMLPTRGSGSQGGFDGTVSFTNGSSLEFMGATGNDSRRSSSTAQVLMKTEVDRFDEAGELSREASPAETMEDRVASFSELAFIYEECTRTTVNGRIHQQILKGTGHRPMAPCPHCLVFVYPLREHLVGYEDASTIGEAIRDAAFICPSCAVILTDEDRARMQDESVSIARGQAIARGPSGEIVITGDEPDTDVFSYEWNAFANRFWRTEQLVRWEWRAMVGASVDDEEKQSRQKRWSLPAEPKDFELEPITPQAVYERHNLLVRGEVPHDATIVTAGIDIRKTQLHYAVVAWRPNGSGHIVDYGIWDTPWRELGVSQAIATAIVDLTQAALQRPLLVVENGKPLRTVTIGHKLYDLSWETDAVREGLRRLASRGVRQAKGLMGRGQSEPPGRGAYSHPERISDQRPWLGQNCYARRRREISAVEIVANSDEWKSFVRRGIGPDTPAGAPGSLTAWTPLTADEKKLAREFAGQICAEVQVVKRVPRRGEVIVWEHRNHRPNHFGDALYYACVAANLGGIRAAVEKHRGSILSQAPAKPLAS